MARSPASDYDSRRPHRQGASSGASSLPAPPPATRTGWTTTIIWSVGCHSLVDVDRAVDYTPRLTPSDSKGYVWSMKPKSSVGSHPECNHTHRQKFTRRNPFVRNWTMDSNEGPVPVVHNRPISNRTGLRPSA